MQSTLLLLYNREVVRFVRMMNRAVRPNGDGPIPQDSGFNNLPQRPGSEPDQSAYTRFVAYLEDMYTVYLSISGSDRDLPSFMVLGWNYANDGNWYTRILLIMKDFKKKARLMPSTNAHSDPLFKQWLLNNPMLWDNLPRLAPACPIFPQGSVGPSQASGSNAGQVVAGSSSSNAHVALDTQAGAGNDGSGSLQETGRAVVEAFNAVLDNDCDFDLNQEFGYDSNDVHMRAEFDDDDDDYFRNGGCRPKKSRDRKSIQ